MRNFVSFFVLCIFAGPLAAQYWTYNPAANNAIMMDVQRSGIMASIASESKTGLSSIPEAPSATYTPSISIRKKNLANFVAKTRTIDPAQADKMEALFASGDIIVQIDSAIAPYGLTVSNAADAYAVWWVAAWQAANDDARDLSGATYKAVSVQAARGFASSPEFTRATDAQKQEMAEAMLIQAALIDASKQAYTGDPALMQQLSKAVKQGAKASGIDLDSMTLTEQGFAKVDGGKTGAAKAKGN
jgi:hypothetical protein